MVRAVALSFLVVIVTLTSCSEELCDNTCPFANDGVCDDGGEGSTGHVCQLGSDCNDCGERKVSK